MAGEDYLRSAPIPNSHDGDTPFSVMNTAPGAVVQEATIVRLKERRSYGWRISRSSLATITAALSIVCIAAAFTNAVVPQAPSHLPWSSALTWAARATIWIGASLTFWDGFSAFAHQLRYTQARRRCIAQLASLEEDEVVLKSMMAADYHASRGAQTRGGL
jgi:hypothetical protein